MPDLKMIGRGAAGGVVADIIKTVVGLIVFCILYPKRIGYLDNFTTVLSFGLLGIPPALVIGAAVGGVILLIVRLGNRNFGIIARVLVGIGFMWVLGAVILLLNRFS